MGFLGPAQDFRPTFQVLNWSLTNKCLPFRWEGGDSYGAAFIMQKVCPLSLWHRAPWRKAISAAESKNKTSPKGFCSECKTCMVEMPAPIVFGGGLIFIPCLTFIIQRQNSSAGRGVNQTFWPQDSETAGISTQSPQVLVFWTLWHLSSGSFPMEVLKLN